MSCLPIITNGEQNLNELRSCLKIDDQEMAKIFGCSFSGNPTKQCFEDALLSDSQISSIWTPCKKTYDSSLEECKKKYPLDDVCKGDFVNTKCNEMTNKLNACEKEKDDNFGMCLFSQFSDKCPTIGKEIMDCGKCINSSKNPWDCLKCPSQGKSGTTQKTGTNSKTNIWMWVSVGLGVFVVLVILMAILTRRR